MTFLRSARWVMRQGDMRTKLSALSAKRRSPARRPIFVRDVLAA